MRTIEIIGSNEIKRTGRVPGAAEYAAIGYLASWGIGDYDRVKIFFRDEDEILACYYAGDADRPGFVLGAIWNDGAENFGFHS